MFRRSREGNEGHLGGAGKAEGHLWREVEKRGQPGKAGRVSRAGHPLIGFPSESLIFCPKMSE